LEDLPPRRKSFGGRKADKKGENRRRAQGQQRINAVNISKKGSIQTFAQNMAGENFLKDTEVPQSASPASFNWGEKGPESHRSAHPSRSVFMINGAPQKVGGVFQTNVL